MQILDQFCLWESPLKFVFQWSKISTAALTDLINAVYIEYIEICWQNKARIQRESQNSNPLKKLTLYAVSQPHLSISVFTSNYRSEKNTEPVKEKVFPCTFISTSQAQHITGIFHQDAKTCTKKWAEDRMWHLCSLKLHHPAYLSNNHDEFITSIRFSV